MCCADDCACCAADCVLAADGRRTDVPWESVLKTSSRLSSSLSFFPRRLFFPPLPLFFGMVGDVDGAKGASFGRRMSSLCVGAADPEDEGPVRCGWSVSVCLGARYENAMVGDRRKNMEKIAFRGNALFWKCQTSAGYRSLNCLNYRRFFLRLE